MFANEIPYRTRQDTKVRTVNFTTRPELRGTFGMVASTHWLASAAGMAVLERGGNAFDAAAAAGFALPVVEPHRNGPGGDMRAVLYDAKSDEVVVVCGQGPAPRAATIDAFRQRGIDLIPGTGLLPAVVPGAFGGWLLMLERYGTWRLADVLEFAIGFAEHGFPVIPSITRVIGQVEELFRNEWPSSAEVFLPAPEPGTLFRSPGVAGTYRRIVDEAGGGTREQQIARARDAWYRGFVAEVVGDFVRADDGFLTADDMAGWQATIEQPTSLDYRGHTVFKTGPWGQGPVFLQQLALLAGFDLAAASPAEFVHTVVECAKLAFADREAWYGDPDFADVPLDLLLSSAYADERRALVGDTASAELRPGGESPRLPSPVTGAAAAGVGEPTRAGDTCHVDVVDGWGNLVSATPSGGWLWSSPVVPALGFPLGTRAPMFWRAAGRGGRRRTRRAPPRVVGGGGGGGAPPPGGPPKSARGRRSRRRLHSAA